MQINERFLYEKEKAIYAQQLGMNTGFTTEQRLMLQSFRKEKHDLINELLAIRGGIEQNDRETMLRSMDRIIRQYRSLEAVAGSGNSTIDTIINFKYAAAQQYGIAFDLKLFVPPEIPIEPCDLGIVLGNALDNAMEAVRTCTASRRVIRISMSIRKDAWIMVIRNPYELPLRTDRAGELLSTKPDPLDHGYGLKSIRHVAEEYQGEAIVDTSDNLFRLTVVLNLKRRGSAKQR